MPARRAARRSPKPPLDVEALWAIKRIGAPTLSPDGALACAAVTRSTWTRTRARPSCGCFRPGSARRARAAKPRRLTAGDKDGDPRWSPDGRCIAFTAKRKDDTEPQVYLIAPDGGEATRLTTLATGARRSSGFPTAGASRSCPGCGPTSPATPRRRSASRSARKPRSRRTSPSAREYRYWDHWLTDGREPHIFASTSRPGARATCSRAPGSRCRRGNRRAEHYDIAPDGREIALTVDPRRGAAHDEPARHRRRRRRDAAQAHVTSAQRAAPTSIRAIRPTARASRSRRSTPKRAFNDQGQLALLDRAQRRSRAARAALRSRDHASSQWTRRFAALLFLREDRGRVGLWRLRSTARRAGADRRRRRRCPASRARRTAACSRTCAIRREHPPALFASRGDGSGERSIEIAQSRAARAPRVRRGARVHDQGLERRAGADVRHVSARTSIRSASGR